MIGPHLLGRTLEHDPASWNYRHPVRMVTSTRNVYHTLNGPHLDQGNVGSCHDPETEVLTRQGWLPWPEVTLDNELATVDPSTGGISFERPTRVIAKHHRGRMYSVEAQGKNFRVTGDHRMLVRKWDEHARTLADEYTFTTMESIGWYSGLMTSVHQSNDVKSYVIPGIPGYKRADQREDLVVPMSLWLQFLGLYIADGTMCARAGSPYRIQLAATKERKREYYCTILDALGIHYTPATDRLWINNGRLYRHLEELGYKGIHAPDKHVPRFVFEQSSENIEEFLHGHREGDGAFQQGTWTHFTSSPQLADDLQELAFLAGYKTGRSVRDPRTSLIRDRIVTSKRPQYAIRALKGTLSSIERKKDVQVEDYDGMVYCANVPTHHTLVTRRHGYILISGNCEGNTAAEWLNTAKALKNRWAYNMKDGLAGTKRSLYLDEVDAVRLYSSATHLDYNGIPGQYPPDDTGTSGVGIAKAMKAAGGLVQYNWTFTWEAFLASLATQPIMLGTNWYDSMFEYDRNGYVYAPSSSDNPAGGHAYLGFVLDYTHTRVGCTNHWVKDTAGTPWGTRIGGHDGSFWISFSLLKRLLIDEQGDSLVPVLM